MKVYLKPLYSQLNAGVGNCPLGCTKQCLVKEKSTLGNHSNYPCPLSLHQAETYREILQDTKQPIVVFNTSATGDGKSLGGYLPSLLNKKYRTIGLYPTIELIKDQERQIRVYCDLFNLDANKQADSLYGTELGRRVEQAKLEQKRANKFNELRNFVTKGKIILTNPDIFHLITHLRYYDPSVANDYLLGVLTQTPDLYLADEFHIFGEHQETALLNSMLLIKHSRESSRPLRFLFTSATPKTDFIEQLRDSGFLVKDPIEGKYLSEDLDSIPLGYRQICQKIELEFIKVEDGQTSLNWLLSNIESVASDLKNENQRQGRGLIILNSLARVRHVVNALKEKLSPDIEIREISGVIDDQEREIIRKELQTLNKPMLIVGTSAVDIGVDFEINLLIFENNNLATFLQRLGRLGRHSGFNNYKAFVLIPDWMKWIWQQVDKLLTKEQSISRQEFNLEIAPQIFNSPSSYQEYRNYWGAVQTQGMLECLSGFTIQGKNRKYEREELRNRTAMIRDSIAEDGFKIYGDRFEKKHKHWCALFKVKAIQDELLRFRGSSSLQAAVWDESQSRFYTYDLLRLLPHVEIEVITKKEFFTQLEKANRSKLEFDEKYIHIFLKVNQWLEHSSLFEIELECEYWTREIETCQPTELEGIFLKRHPQKSDINEVLGNINFLSFIVRVDRRDPKSHWTVKNKLRLPATFGIYRLTDVDNQAYAIAFNQDALLLEALKWKIPRCKDSEPLIY